MPKHGKPDSDQAHDGTDLATPFRKLSAEQKGKEFDTSFRNPSGYARRNFSAHQLNMGMGSGRQESR